MIYMFLSNNPSSGDINSSNLPTVPLVQEKTSLQRVIIKWYTCVEEPNGHYLKLK